MKLSDNKYTIPQRHLTMATEGLLELVRRLEYDAAAYATVESRECKLRSAELMEQAAAVRESADFFLGL